MTQKANGVGVPGRPVNEVHVGGACQYWNKGDTANWDPNTRLLVFAADGNGGQVPVGDSIQLVSATLQSALYATNPIENDTTSAVIGPMIGGTVVLGQSVTTFFPAIKIVPAGMPSLRNTIYAQPRATAYTG